jgi:hypothetical protein
MRWQLNQHVHRAALELHLLRLHKHQPPLLQGVLLLEGPAKEATLLLLLLLLLLLQNEVLPTKWPKYPLKRRAVGGPGNGVLLAKQSKQPKPRGGMRVRRRGMMMVVLTPKGQPNRNPNLNQSLSLSLNLW